MKEQICVLVVDDEEKICEAVSAYLASKGFTVYTAASGKRALEIFAERDVRFVILDIMLPDISGEEVCAAIRKSSAVPVIMLTARAGEEDVLRGLELGADDYVTKPFSIKQLYARMEAVMRRSSGSMKPAAAQYSWNGGDLKVNFSTMEAEKAGKPVSLTSGEWKILAALVKRPNAVFTREQLILAAFGDDCESFDRIVDTHVKNLRKKIETDTKNPVYVLTVRGSGYKFGGKQ